MIAIVIGVLVTISSLMLAFFLAVSNVSFIVENDFVSKANQNAVLHALAEGQLAYRAKTLTKTANNTKIDPGYLRDFHDGTFNNMQYNITLMDDDTIEADVEIK